MPRLLHPAATLVAILALTPVASAKPAYPPLCEVDPVIVGDAAGSHAFRVLIRGDSGTPEARVLVTLDFSQTSAHLFAVQEAGTKLDCAARTLSRVTDGCTGIMDVGRFAPLLLDGSTAHPEADFDGSGGPVGLGDLAIFAHDLLSGAKGTYSP